MLSPDLFSLYEEYIMRESKGAGGVKAWGQTVNNERYADHSVLIVDSQDGVQGLLQEVEDSSEERGLNKNVKNRMHGHFKGAGKSCM